MTYQPSEIGCLLNQSKVSALKLDALFLPISWNESNGESEELIVCGASAFIPLIYLQH